MHAKSAAGRKPLDSDVDTSRRAANPRRLNSAQPRSSLRKRWAFEYPNTRFYPNPRLRHVGISYRYVQRISGLPAPPAPRHLLQTRETPVYRKTSGESVTRAAKLRTTTASSWLETTSPRSRHASGHRQMSHAVQLRSKCRSPPSPRKMCGDRSEDKRGGPGGRQNITTTRCRRTKLAPDSDESITGTNEISRGAAAAAVIAIADRTKDRGQDVDPACASGRATRPVPQPSSSVGPAARRASSR